jgi:hypothetical protein
MEKVLRFSGAEVARMSRSTVEATSQEVEKFLLGGCSWSYNTARNLVLPIYSGLSRAAAVAACDRIKHQVARSQNTEVALLVFEKISGRTLSCYPITPRLLPFRRDLACRVNPIGLIVENRRLSFAWLQPRKAFALDDLGLAMYAAMIKNRYMKDDDFAGADVEFLDFSCDRDSKARNPRLLTFAHLPQMSEEQLTDRLSIFASAIDKIVEKGVKRAERAKKQPTDSSGQSRLFE